MSNRQLTSELTRRTFLGGAALAAAALGGSRLADAEPLGLPIGFQGYDAPSC